jgi:hypothetical protein
VEELPGPVRVAVEERRDEQDQAEDGEPGAHAEEHVEPAGEGALGEAFAERRGHRGLSPVEPVALGPGGMPTAAPAGSGASGACPWSFRTWFTIAQRSLGR